MTYTTPGTQLVREDGTVVAVGERVIDFRGNEATVRGWRAGSHPGSTGRVLVDDGWGSGPHEYFPSVYSLRVVDTTHEAATEEAGHYEACHRCHDGDADSHPDCSECAEDLTALMERLATPY